LISEFIMLWGRLQEVELIPTYEDRITWLHTSNGRYTARSAYELQFIGSIASATAENHLADQSTAEMPLLCMVDASE
jgi:hypothetical protein